MGFDKHFYEDHCYLDDSADGVGMNVEIIQDNYEVAQNNGTNEKAVVSYSEVSGSPNNEMSYISCEDNKKCSKRALVFLPYSEYCTEHTGMFLHEDEKLVKPGDKFRSHDDFVQYLNDNAKRWCFYYKCSDSRKPNTEHETYTYNCVYLRNKEKYKKKGLRKRNNNMKTDCPCKIKLRHLPNEKELTVVYVCNHHDHELSVEEFYKLQHGRRLPPYVKEEIMDLLQLKVDLMRIRAYVEMETGFSMSRPFFYALEKNMKSRNEEREITEERLIMLKDKISAVFGYSDDQDGHQEIQENTDETETPKKIKSLKKAERTRKISPLKRRSKASDEVTSSDDCKRIKIGEHSESTFNNETLQSVKHLQDSVKCEIQTNPWVADQCVPVLPNRTVIENKPEESIHVQTIEGPQDEHSSGQYDSENTYVIEYYYPGSDNENQEIVSNEFGDTINDGEVNDNEGNDIENIAYETVVTDNQVEVQNDILEYVDHNETTNDTIEIHIENSQEDVNDSQDDQNETVNDVLSDNTQAMDNEEHHVEYISENSDIVEHVDEINEVNNEQEVDVRTANESGSSHSLLPVFDVYMKDGNVTGFVVNNNSVGALKDSADKGIQTSEELMLSDLYDLENEDFGNEVIYDVTSNESSDTYTKHEYVHKYNIDKYMVQPHFPKYIQTLAKETYMDALHMFTNVYNEKAMFKITTTQKGKEGNTRIWYVTDFPRSKRREEARSEKDEANRESLGKNLQSIFLLKEEIKSLKKQRRELISKNRQLEEVALKLVEMT